MPDYDITSPDGKTYRVTAPEGATQAQVLAYAQQHHASQPDHSAEALNPEPAESSSWDENTQSYMPNIDVGNTLAGIGSGMTRTMKGIGNVESKILEHLPFGGKQISGVLKAAANAGGNDITDAGLDAQDEIDKALHNTQSGRIGQNVGSTVVGMGATGPAGAEIGTGSALARVGLPMARSALEGGMQGAAVAPSQEQGQGAALGAAVGGGLSAVGQTGGRLISGLVKKSQAAKDLEQLAGQSGKEMFLPLSQAAEDSGISGKVGNAYRTALPLLPGAMGPIVKQEDAAQAVFRQMALDEADPTGASIAANASKDPYQARKVLRDAFDNSYRSTVGSYSFNVPTDFKKQVADEIQANMPNVDKTTLDKVSEALDKEMRRYASGNPIIDGENLLNAKKGSVTLGKKLSNPVERQAAEHGVQAFDNLIEDELTQGNSPSNIADLGKFQGLKEPASAFSQVSKAISASKTDSGRFTPAQLLRASDDSGPVYHLANSAQEVLGQPAVKPDTAGRVLAYSLGGLGGYKNPLLLGAALVGANGLASRTAQRALMGDLKAQQALQKLLDDHPDMAAAVGTTVRAIAAQQAGEDNGGPH